MTELFTQFWWLIFPILAMLFGLVQLVLRNRYEQKKLDLMKAYVERGQPVPDDLKRHL